MFVFILLFILCIIPNLRQQTCGCTLLFIYPLTDYIDEDEQVRHNLSTYYYHFFALRRGSMTEKLNGTTETVDFDVSSSVRFSTALAYCLGDHLPH